MLCRRGLSGVGRVADLVVELTNTERILLSDEILEGMEGEGGTTVDRPSSVLWAGMITTELIFFYFVTLLCVPFLGGPHGWTKQVNVFL